jgi:hypothetical protein
MHADGDGITIEQDSAATVTPTNILVANNFIEDWYYNASGRRNGIAVDDGQYVVVANNRFQTPSTGGANAAIDIEPNAGPASAKVTDVAISGNVAVNYSTTGIGISIVPNVTVARISVIGNVMNVPASAYYVVPGATEVSQSGNVWANGSAPGGPVDVENVRTIVTKSSADGFCPTGSSAIFTPRAYVGQTGTYICSQNVQTARTCAAVKDVVVRMDNSYFAYSPDDQPCSASVPSPWPYGGMYVTTPDTTASDWNIGTVLVVCCQ